MTAITATSGKSLSDRWDAFERRRAFAGQRVEFLADLGQALIEGKSSINQVLSASARRTPDPALSAAYRDVRDRLKGGMKLHVAFAPYFEPVENLLIESINTNAKTDTELGNGFVTAAGMIQNLSRTGKGLTQVMIDLAMALLTIGFVWLGVAHFAAAQFEQISPRKYWPEMSRIVIGMGDAMAGVWPITLGVIVALVAATAWAMPNWVGPRRRWADQKLPGFKLYRLVRALPLQMALGTFLAARIGFDKAIKSLVDRANPWERMYLHEMLGNLSGKHKRGVDIVDVGLFDWQAMVRVEVRSSGTDLDEALQHVAVQSAPRLVALLEKRVRDASTTIKMVQRIVITIVVASTAFVYLSTVQTAGRAF